MSSFSKKRQNLKDSLGQQIEEITNSEELYRFLFQNSNDAMFVSLRKKRGTLPSKFIAVNDTAIERLGYSREELLQMTPIDISAPFVSIAENMEILAKDKQVLHEQIHITKSGQAIQVEISTRAFELRGKEVNLSIARDITERKKAEEMLRIQSAALNVFADAIVITDLKGRIQWINTAWSILTGYLNEEEVIGQNLRILKSGTQDASFYQNLWDTILAGNVWQNEIVNKRKDGSLYTEEQTITPIRDERGEITHFIAIKRDISERKQAEEEMKQISTHDALTQIYNRSFFEGELARLENGRQYPISLVMADVDYLKKTNDLKGHEAGDNLLKSAAQLLKSAFRSDDIVARIGGDEFSVIMPNTDMAVAKEALQRVRRKLKEYNAVQTGTPISISFGVGTATDKTVSLRETLKEADNTMYDEKQIRRYSNSEL